MLKKLFLNSINKGLLGNLLEVFGASLRDRPKILGFTNPVHMTHVTNERDGALMLTEAGGYAAREADMPRFDPDRYEPDIGYLMKTLIRPDDVVLDIGANIGLHTVTMARAAHRGRLFAFEPVPEMALQNDVNRALNRLDNVTLVKCALGDENTELEMRVSVGDADKQGTSTFIGQNDNVDENPDGYEIRLMKVRRLDDIVGELDIPSRIGFVKIDTEGFETRVLEGGMKTIAEHKPILLVEAHSTRLAQEGKSWQWFLDTFPDHHALIIHTLTRAKPYLHLEPLTAEQAEICVNLLLLPAGRTLDP